MHSIRTIILLSVVLSLAACKKETSSTSTNESEAAQGNQALYDSVMAVHDEVMPKMNDIYKLKNQLKKKLSISDSLTNEKKEKIERTISALDSANDGMMIWMREFNPLPDSLGKEEAREYLMREMEKVKKVRKDIYSAIEKANSER